GAELVRLCIPQLFDYVVNVTRRVEFVKQTSILFVGRFGETPFRLAFAAANALQFHMTSLAEVIQYTDDYLRVGEICDWANALNGLQIQNSGRVTKIGAAVDVSTRVLNEAA